MDKKSDILTKVGKDAGFNVPEGYFADFAKKMAASLPEKQIPAKRKPTRAVLRNSSTTRYSMSSR